MDIEKTTVPCHHNRTFTFAPATTALLLIDFQKEFFIDGSEAELKPMNAIIPRVQKLLAWTRQIGCHIVYTRESYHSDLHDVHPYRQALGYVGKPTPLGRFCILGEPGHEFVEEIRPLSHETIIDKAGFSAFYNSSLESNLQGHNITHLIICGVTTQCCVHSTLREAVDRGYWCLTVADCCAALDPNLHDAALSLIAGEGHLFGWVADSTAFIEQ